MAECPEMTKKRISIFTKIFSVTDLSTTLLNRSTEPNKSLKQSGKQDSLKSIENVS